MRRFSILFAALIVAVAIASSAKAGGQQFVRQRVVVPQRVLQVQGGCFGQQQFVQRVFVPQRQFFRQRVVVPQQQFFRQRVFVPQRQFFRQRVVVPQRQRVIIQRQSRGGFGFLHDLLFGRRERIIVR